MHAMIWIMLVYVITSNGFNSTPSIAPGFRGATFATKEECTAAAAHVVSIPSAGSDDVAKTSLLMVCAPTQPPAPEPPPPAEVAAPAQPVQAPVQPTQPAFPPYPPPPKRSHH
jgi:hypothetical protein